MLLTPPNTTSVWWFNHFLQAKPGSIVCRYMVYTLAIWTIISHIHVFFGGSLFQLIITAFTILCLYTILIVSIKFDLISFLSIRAIDKIWTNQSLPLYIPRLNPSASIESYFYIKLKWIIGLGGAILVAILFYISKSFLVYWWASVIYYSAAYLFVIVLNDNDPPNTSSTKPSYPISWEFYLILLSMIALCIGLVINRPNIDDSLYVNIAVTAADFPFSPLMGFDGLHNPGFPFAPSEYKLQTIELLHGALSWITGISAIYFPHIILYAFWAALIPLAYAELVKSLVPKYLFFASSRVGAYDFCSGFTTMARQFFVSTFATRQIDSTQYYYSFINCI